MQCQLLEKKLVDSQLFFEFEKIPKKKQNAEFSSANHADNIARNRLEIKKKKLIVGGKSLQVCFLF